ncbi:hypothetical protein [Micromonospora psammae]
MVVALTLVGGVVHMLVPTDEEEATERCHDASRDKLFSPSTAVFAEDVQ